MPYIGNELATQFQAFVTQTITGDGSTGYTLDRAVANGKELLVYINNVKQEEGSGKSYTASGTTITFSEAVTSGDSCYLVYLGSAVQTVVPPDASVVSGMIANANLELPNTLDMNGKELILDADADTSITSDTDDQIDFKTGGTDRMVISSAGKVGIGVTPAKGMLHIQPSARTTNFDASDHTTYADIYVHNPTDDDTCATGIAFATDASSFDNGASGIACLSGTGDSESSLAFITRPNGAVAAERMRIFSDGTFTFFKTTTADATAGITFDPSGLGTFTRSDGTVFVINRQSTDGTLVDFRNANSTEGTIGISGSTVSYNGFSGLHESSGIATDVAIGTVVSTIDELDVYPSKQKNSRDNSEEDHPKAGQARADHAKIKISDSVGDKRVYGVLQSYDNNGKPLVASVGIGSIKVTGACAGGDLLESNGDGTAKVQSDDVIRSKTIGKVTIGNSNTGVKLVSCVLYCG